LSGNPNYQAGYFAVSATLLLMYRRCEVGFRRGLYSFAIAVAWLGCFLCLSRSGAFALIVGAAGHWLLLSARRFSLRRIFVALIPVVGIILLLFSEATMELRNRLTFSDDPRVESLAQVGQSLEDISRFEAAGYAIDLFAAHPLLGVGLGTFAARNFEARGSYVAPHNSLLGSLAETGLVGVLALWFVFRALFRATDPAARKYIAPTVVAAIAFAAFADVLNSLEVVTVLFLVYSCCARFGAAPFEERVAKPAAAARHLSLHAPPVGDTI
jgi:O-antigen ligase